MKRPQARHSFTAALLLLLIIPGNSSPLAAEIAPPEEQPAPAEKSEKDKKGGGQRSGAAPQRIHPDVVKRLRPDSPENLMSGADPRPFVMITLRNAAPPDASPKQKREFAAKAQDDLLKKLAPGEFEVKHRFGSEPRAIGYIKASALDKLANDDQVIAIELSRIEPGIFAALQASPEGEARVVVGLKRDQLPAKREERIAWIGKAQNRVLRKLDPGEFRLASKYKYIPSFFGHIKLRGVEKLAIDNDVSRVSLDTMHYGADSRGSSATDPPESSSRTAMLEESVPFLGADAVHDLEYTGQDVTIAILDNGVDCSHPDVKCAGPGVLIVGGPPVPGGGDTAGVDSWFSPRHGTQMAAIITAPNGVAPNAKVLPVRLALSGAGGPVWFESDALKGMEYIIDNAGSYPNLRIINYSGGGSCNSMVHGCTCDLITYGRIQDWKLVIDAAAHPDFGIITFVASGNDGQCSPAGLPVPACLSAAATVAAVFEDPFSGTPFSPNWSPCPSTCSTCQCSNPAWNLGQVMCISNRPPDPCPFFLGAPGYDIDIGSGNIGGGSSMGTAHASGVAALIIEKAGCGLSASGIESLLWNTGTQVVHVGDPCGGIAEVPASIDAFEAVTNIETFCTLLGEPSCTGAGPGLLDVLIFLHRMTGVGVPYAAGLSTCLDFPSSPPDGDIDLHDFAAFQLAFSGTAQGACCDINQMCTDGLEEDCTDYYLGDFTKCAETLCPPIGACCTLLGVCSDGTQEECTGCPPSEPNCPQHNGATYQGDGTTCSTDPCGTAPPTGACCQQDGTCDDDMQEANCLAANGLYQGDTILCINVTCEQPEWLTGACCMMDGSCVDAQTEADCWATGWSYQGDGSTCATDACGPTGACCMGDGTCIEDLTIAECDTAGGTNEGDGTVCTPNPCVQPAAACCDGINCLDDMTPDDCDTAGGDYQGGGTMCEGYDCGTFGACCLPDASCADITAAACAFQAGLYAGDPTACADPGMDCSVDDDGGTLFGVCQTTEDKLLTDVNAEVGDKFGTGVALSGGLAVVGAPNAGAAHLFRLGAANCDVEQFTLTGPDPLGGDDFGAAVAMSADTAVVGAPATDMGGFSNVGSAHVFKEPFLGWQDMYETATLTKADLFDGADLGRSVAIREDGAIVLVGAPLDCVEASCFCNAGEDKPCGSVCVYYEPLFGWEDTTEFSTLVALDPEWGDRFGTSVAISGTAAVVGANEANHPGLTDAGAAYVFRSNASGLGWAQEDKLTASDAAAEDDFGASVSISGDVVLVGAPLDDHGMIQNAGSVYVFSFDLFTALWHQQAKLTASDGAEHDQFGFSVSISGDLAVIGAHHDDDAAADSGSMYVFRFDGFDWNEEAKLTASDASIFDSFGTSVSVDGDRAVAGAIKGEAGVGNSGAAYVFEGLGDCNESQTTDLCDIINDPSIDCCPPSHNCCETGHGPGCNDVDIEACVCGTTGYEYCCDSFSGNWDETCVLAVEALACDSCSVGNGIIDDCECCPPDLDGNGDVGPLDLAMLLGVWGPCPGGCPEDLSLDCVVGALDLAILLGWWGTCPSCSGQAQWNGPRDGGGLRFAFGGGNGCLSLEEAVQMLGHDDVGAFIEWVLSAVPPNVVYQVAQFLLWLMDHWPC